MAQKVPTVSFLSAWEKFKTSHCEEIVIELSTSIHDILSVFHENVDYSLLYTPLCELVGDNTASSLLLSQTLSLLNKLVEEKERRQELITVVLPAISYQILHRYRQQPSDSLIKLCLKSLRSAAQDVRITYISQYTSQLIQLLVKMILRKDAMLLDDALAVLASLCRNNLIVQGSVKSMDNIRSLYSRLMTLLGDDNISVIVHSLSLFTALCLNEDLGNKLFVGNVTETYTLVINMLNSGDEDTKLYCLNLLIDFTKSETMLSAFVSCQGTLLADLVQSDFLDGMPCIRDKVCELLQQQATKDSDLYTKIVQLFSVDITRSLIDQLGNHGNNTALLGLLHVLLPDVCENSQDNRDVLIKQLTVNIENIPLHSECKQGYMSVTLSCECLRVLHQDPLCQDTISSSLSSLPQFIFSWLDSAPNPYDIQSNPGRESCRAALGMLTLCVDLKLKDYHNVLSHPHLPSFIGQAMLSEDSSLIATALRINSLCFEGTDTFAPTIYRVGSILAHHWYLIQSNTNTVKQELCELKQKYSDLQRKSSRLEDERCPSPQIAQNSQISELIAQMRDGLNIKDVKSSQLIEIFQEKVAIMTTKEELLNDLVEAKTMALQQSDRLFTQFKNRVAQAEKECEKYRTLLHQSELEGEANQDQMCTVLKDKNDLLAEVENLRLELSESRKFQEKYVVTCEELNQLKDNYTQAVSLISEQTDKLEGLKEEVEILRVHNDTLKSQHESDVNQVQVLQKEKQKVVTKLEEKDSLYLKTKQSLRQSEEKNRKKDKEKIEVESQLSKTRSDLAKTDSKYKELLEKEKTLGYKLSEQEKQIATQAAHLAAQTQEIEKYSKLIAMFHNLSSGKVSTQR